jgi:hypothetical protein
MTTETQGTPRPSFATPIPHLPVGSAFDPVSGDVWPLLDPPGEDANGQLEYGDDDDGFWYGTARAVAVLGTPTSDGPDDAPRDPKYFVVHAWDRAAPFDLHLIADDESIARDFCRSLGLRVDVLFQAAMR